MPAERAPLAKPRVLDMLDFTWRRFYYLSLEAKYGKSDLRNRSGVAEDPHCHIKLNFVYIGAYYVLP